MKEDLYSDENEEARSNGRRGKRKEDNRHEYEDDDEEEDVVDDDDDDDDKEEGGYQQMRPLVNMLSYGRAETGGQRTTTKHMNVVNRNKEKGGQTQTPNDQGIGGVVQFDYTPAVSSTTGLSLEEQSYWKHLQTIGYQQMPLSTVGNVKTYVGSTLFKRLKFIVSEEEMESGGVITSTVMNHFKIPEVDKVSWWRENKKIVHAEVRLKRNNAGVQLRTAFRSK